MLRLLAPLPALTLLLSACGGDADPVVDDPDGGVMMPVDTGVVRPDVGPRPDMGRPDVGPPPDMGPPPDTGPYDAGMPDLGPPPPDTVSVSGRVKLLGAHLGGVDDYSGQTNVLAYGVSPPQTAVADAQGSYSITLPANGQTVMTTLKPGYNQTFYNLTTQAQDIPDRTLYIAESAWVSAIATAHNVQLAAAFACQTPSLVGQQCLYALLVGQILDDGTAGQGQLRPVAGVEADDFSISGPSNEAWYVRGPYFLDYDGTPAADADESITYEDNGTYRGGLYAVFAEVPVRGPQSIGFQIAIEYPYRGATRYFGPVRTQGFRAPGSGVTWVNVPETGVAPPPPQNDIDFDTQVYPLFLPVDQGGLGCQGCHTNQGGVTPAGGMNLYGGPDVAYASLDPNQYPDRVDVTDPAASLLLTKPLYEVNGPQNHAIFAFVSEQDPGYQIIYTWIGEGAERDVNDQPLVSFYEDIRPLLYQPTANGGAGCVTCHGVAQNPPGGFYVGGDGNALYEQLVNTAPTNAGPYNELYRINRDGYPERSLVLTNPLFGNAEPHPVKIFFDNADPRYQTIYRWIVEGYVNDTP